MYMVFFFALEGLSSAIYHLEEQSNVNSASLGDLCIPGLRICIFSRSIPRRGHSHLPASFPRFALIGAFEIKPRPGLVREKCPSLPLADRAHMASIDTRVSRIAPEASE